ncbi:hypothetical protein NKJ04_17425 [Mesorhizobium sp. M0618]|uniref:hypothetical protein n=1 Tax=Mesorhizobium sp. M0618 TaxID=2956972 RepID=UPI00333BFF3A
MKIIAVDNLNREYIADKHILGGIPNASEHQAKAQEFCDWANSFGCSDFYGMFYRVVENDYRLSRGMEDLI